MLGNSQTEANEHAHLFYLYKGNNTLSGEEIIIIILCKTSRSTDCLDKEVKPRIVLSE